MCILYSRYKMQVQLLLLKLLLLFIGEGVDLCRRTSLKYSYWILHKQIGRIPIYLIKITYSMAIHVIQPIIFQFRYTTDLSARPWLLLLLLPLLELQFLDFIYFLL